MKTTTLILLLFLTSNTFAQFTAIPDPNFEQALIDLGHDDVIDGQVLTANINVITWLDVADYDIEDLTGVEDFTALEILEADNNFLSSIDVSNNLNLQALWLDFNQLTSIDLSNNLNLQQVILDANFLTEIDVSFLENLSSLWIDENLIENLDLSENPLLDELYCSFNPNLTFINIKNGNNSILEEFEATNLATNACIQVDDAAAATAGTTFPYNLWLVDQTASFSENCVLSVSNLTQLNLNTYPNPVEDVLFVDTNEPLYFTIYTVQGQKLIDKTVLKTNGIDLSKLSPGVYFVEFQSANKGTTVKKVIKK